jgi:hypothetical protein
MSLDQFWVDYEEGCNELAGVATVEKVIDICYRRWGRSAGDAFFPGGCGDAELLSILMEAGWRPVWVKAHYYFAARQPRDVCTICHERIELAPILDNPECANRWVHSHADKDMYCGTGDGATAIPGGGDGLTYIEGDIQRGVQRPLS